jgi:hypothetical protein
MKNITIWAASAVIAVLGACTTDATIDNGDGGTSGTTSGAAGSTSTTTTTTTTTTTGTGGSGGSSGDGGTCAVGANPTACDTCAFSMCHDETCACDAVTDCKDARGAYFTCLSGLDGGDMESCAGTFVTAAGAQAGKANDLATCMGDKCQDLCK